MYSNPRSKTLRNSEKTILYSYVNVVISYKAWPIYKRYFKIHGLSLLFEPCRNKICCDPREIQYARKIEEVLERHFRLEFLVLRAEVVLTQILQLFFVLKWSKMFIKRIRVLQFTLKSRLQEPHNIFLHQNSQQDSFFNPCFLWVSELLLYSAFVGNCVYVSQLDLQKFVVADFFPSFQCLVFYM